jgi:hypothetical protein
MATRFENEKAPLGVERIARAEDDSMASNRGAQSNVSRLRVRESDKSLLARFFRRLAGFLTIAAVLASAALLLTDVAPQLLTVFKLLGSLAPKAWTLLSHGPMSAMPLLLAGFSYISLQLLLRPRGLELIKRLMLGSAFLLWGIVQLMPPGSLATNLGDFVISLYVLDLGLMIQTELRSAR